jgi:hypothetical protein
VSPLLPDENDAARLWAEIYRLREAVKGPAGFDTWQEAATDERRRRVAAEQAARAASPVPAAPQQITAERVTRMMAAIEGECDGLAITREHATAILMYVLAASPASQPPQGAQQEP